MEVTLLFFLECVYLSLLYASLVFDICYVFVAVFVCVCVCVCVSMCWSGFEFHLELFFCERMCGWVSWDLYVVV